MVHVEMGVVGAVDQDVGAEDAERGQERGVDIERAVAVEGFVLDDQQDVVHAVVVGQFHAGACLVVEEEQSGHAAVDVLGGRAVEVGVVPEGGGGLVDRPGGVQVAPGSMR